MRPVRRGTIGALVMALLAPAGIVPGAPAAGAAECPSVSAAGPVIGSVSVGDVQVPLTRVSVDPGGALVPPATNLAAGLSRQHAGLRAKRGTSVITWHVRYGSGCEGALNELLTAPIGTSLRVKAQGQASQEFQIVRRVSVPKGRYPVSWFRQHGPRQLALFSCADLRDGTFRSTVAVFAEPVASEAQADQIQLLNHIRMRHAS